jgi:hypothetical protein
VLVSTGCPAELPIEYETEHLRIGTDLDHPLCQGDLVALERIIARVQDELSIEMRDPATVYLWDLERWDPKSAGCAEFTFGCFNRPSNTVRTSDVALAHEIVHAAMAQHRPAAFFEEGLAEMYGGKMALYAISEPSANVGRKGASIDYLTANHFVRWLRERWGPEPLGRLARTSDRSFSSFEAIYGMSMQAAEALYFEDAPFAYPSFYACDGPELLEEGGAWRGEVELDCASGADTRATSAAMLAHRTFFIREPGYYTISLDAEAFDIFRCSPPRIEQAAPLEAQFADAPVHHATPFGASRHYVGRGRYELFLDAGLHDIALAVLGHERGVARVAITPALGPQPAN